MIRKATTILFILLANFILLVHVVIPHHHHENLICFKHDQQTSDNQNHKNHQHKNNAICSLQNIVVVIQNNQELIFATPQNNIVQFDNFQAFITDSIKINPILFEFIWLKQYHSPPNYSPFLRNHKSLRGPPLV